MNRQGMLEAAFARRRDLFTLADTDCFRLFNGAADGLDGLAIDRYGAWLLVLMTRPELQHDGRLAAAVRRAAAGLPMAVHGIVAKDISRPDSGRIDDAYGGAMLAGAAPPDELVVKQAGIAAGVRLAAGRHTGLFLDMRAVRHRLAPLYAAGGAMLNLFCYSAAFSVHGLKNGLGAALNIDLAKTALDLARRNYALNGLACVDRDFMYGDALTWMRAFAKQGRRFDFVVLDPPTFARAKNGLFSAAKDFPACLELVQSLAPGGRALTVINSPAVTRQQYLGWHPASWRLEWLEHETADFPWLKRPYLKAGLWRVP